MAVTRNEPHSEIARGIAEDGIVLTPQQQRSRRLRSIAIGLAIALFAVMIYAVTIAKIGSHVLDRPL